ncbi:hypothetical protein A462_00069 [Pseudomonas sp. Ag1]|uniref:hypothetical protein n=1 Tax=Pseudomonas sp. Ag1 TaxID=1197727 RepID=UPI000272BAE9|nr:hypothetical protein [Pseudomonas sp. Ag1]EJF74080.1 hypothetical protein A462_00069 [Pseudomonas sp. Ag1]
MSQQNATLLPKEEVVHVRQEEDSNKASQGFTTAKRLWQKEVWWKDVKQAYSQSHVDKKARHDALLE